MSTIPQDSWRRKYEIIAPLVARLVELTDLEQALYARKRLDAGAREQLVELARERAYLLNVKRAARAGADLDLVPRTYPADLGGFRKVVERRRPAPAPALRTLPRGVERMQSGRLRVVVYMPKNTKLSLATFDPTPEQIALASAVHEAARRARDAGLLEVDDIRAAAAAAYRAQVAQAG